MSDYDKRIAAGLQEVYEKHAGSGVFDVEKDRWIIFSDHHRGRRDGADDFSQCEKAYNAALGYYDEKKYTLCVLGDSEELWECAPKHVLKAYQHSLGLEAEFARDNRYLRFWGNHDSDWQRDRAVAKYLQPLYGNGLVVNQALRLTVRAAGDKLGEIFLLHGHQGTIDADRYSAISRLAVRYGWTVVQRIFRIKSTTPAQDFELRQQHNVAMYRWVETKRGMVLIAGHTHRPVFASRNAVDVLQHDLEVARAGASADATLRERVAQLRAELEGAQVQEFGTRSGEKPINQSRPCYFNTGCCSFSDGDVTGLELVDGAIRLVRWPDNSHELRPQVLASMDLRAAFETTSAAAPKPAVPEAQPH
ncbi:MAG TPA: hypothetical protein VF021_04585 [Longimicrobiales bacterium]